MSWRLRRTELAENDLIEIWVHIALDSPAAADRVVRKLTELFESTSEYPRKGRPAPEISPDHRLLFQGSYLLIYHLDERSETVTLVRATHTARDWLKWFDEDDD
ncbi:MAG: type II toxin-antitoxin system RelE/ParE family toxin [Asticcacaulis sp.]|nr:type II toxin-antitoxin system RelE/ParE family toxin [Asticcacaulis sp.]